MTGMTQKVYSKYSQQVQIRKSHSTDEYIKRNRLNKKGIKMEQIDMKLTVNLKKPKTSQMKVHKKD